jgi:hypothetical protein
VIDGPSSDWTFALCAQWLMGTARAVATAG